MNIALKILKKVYNQGDNYHSGETDSEWFARFTNDYPLQHGKGFEIRISKIGNFFTVSKEGKCYEEKISKLLDAETKHLRSDNS